MHLYLTFRTYHGTWIWIRIYRNAVADVVYTFYIAILGDAKWIEESVVSTSDCRQELLVHNVHLSQLIQGFPWSKKALIYGSTETHLEHLHVGGDKHVRQVHQKACLYTWSLNSAYVILANVKIFSRSRNSSYTSSDCDGYADRIWTNKLYTCFVLICS